MTDDQMIEKLLQLHADVTAAKSYLVEIEGFARRNYDRASVKTTNARSGPWRRFE